MLRFLAAAVVAFALVAVAPTPSDAQTIYAPAQYQYGTDNHRYYYGGSDPAVFDLAERQRRFDVATDIPATSSRYNAAYVHGRLIGQLERVYADFVPYMNARVFGYLPVDAHNDANANVPRYFRKADLDAAAVEMPDGSRVVPAAARPVADERGPADRTAARPVIKPRAIIILPKKPARTSDKQVVILAD